jgi:arabinogalactan endo-1,4-beta-galactosidase
LSIPAVDNSWGSEIAVRRSLAAVFALFLAWSGIPTASAQSYAIGADVSFLGKCEQDGVVFKDNGKPKDVLKILREHRYNWVRLRIFHDPSLGDGHLPNDLPYTLRLAKRARAMGFHVLLDLHYSDTWADPGKQFTPVAWSNMDHRQLADLVFVYTRDVIATFKRKGLMPDMVQVGNEITNGMLWPDGKLPGNWDNFADLVKAGIRGVDAGSGSRHRPQIMIHIERSGDLDAAIKFFDNLAARHVPFDVIGLSYYPRWHGDIATLRCNLRSLALRYHHPIIVAEAAFNWRPGDSIGKKSDFPETPEGQRDFLRAVDAAVRAIPDGLGRGVFWWEPAAEGDLRSRSFFDEEGNVLPVISAFDSPTSP